MIASGNLRLDFNAPAFERRAETLKRAPDDFLRNAARGLEIQRVALAAGKRQHIGNKPREPLDFLRDQPEPAAGIGGARGQGFGGEIEIEREIGERRAEFVGDAVDEGHPFGGEPEGAFLLEKQDDAGDG